MAERVGAGWKWLAGILLVLVAVQTLALGAILGRLTEIQAHIMVWERLDSMRH